MKLIAEIIGAVAVISSLVIYQQKRRKKMLICKLLQDLCWGIHYIILGAFSAAATSFICMARSALFYNNDKKFFSSKIWFLIFIVFYASSAALTWNGFFSLFPATASILSTVAFWQKNPKNTKLIQILSSCSTLTYNINVSHSVMVYIGVTLTISSCIISILSEKKKRT